MYEIRLQKALIPIFNRISCVTFSARTMTSVQAGEKLSHVERTAAEPRDKSLNRVVVRSIEQVNDATRVFRLGVPEGGPVFRFLPGQWLDVYCPGVEKAGGFTITSTPREARLPHPSKPVTQSDENSGASADASSSPTAADGPYLELAIASSPLNPAAVYLFRPIPSLLSQELHVRVGGSFVFPPPGINVRTLKRVIFVAGGMGVNPLVSMLSSLSQVPQGFEVRFLYALKDPSGTGDSGSMLFLERISGLFASGKVKGQLKVFLTGRTQKEGDSKRDEKADRDDEGGENAIQTSTGSLTFESRRPTLDDVSEALGTAAERRFAVVYICGVPSMTDDFVERLTSAGEGGLGMEKHRVLCEKWW
ncbi:hypothetical protein F5Y18DRAFT_398817 [Xylariaceae sp. FL1019]|nr:hypothetical protein F5Y18DRAFT_398817 [Xylariaceae sp. FL1019]